MILQEKKKKTIKLLEIFSAIFLLRIASHPRVCSVGWVCWGVGREGDYRELKRSEECRGRK